MKLSVPMMSHVQLGELCDKRKDNVKRTMEDLRDKGLIQLTQIEEVNHLGQNVAIYYVDERGSHGVAARLSPEYTMVLVDFWLAKGESIFSTRM
jgi:phage regulator Rha-like protein